MLTVLVCGSPSRTRVERGIHSRPSDSPESDTLGTWAGIILHNADGGGLALCKPSGGSAASRA
jgi:hypothetical protein